MAASTTVCVLLVAAVTNVLGQVATLCRPNENFLSCGGKEKTCDEPAPARGDTCRTACYCPHDEYRSADGECVKKDKCPETSAAYRLQELQPDENCSEGEEYRFCEPCRRTCDHPYPICPAQCARGCFCKHALVRDEDGSCVEYQKCSKFNKNEGSNLLKPEVDMKCREHQVYKHCMNCEKTCSNPNPVCPAQCSRGCYCREGYFKSPTGECVRFEDCPKDPVVEDCSGDEVYLSCGWCEPSCSDPEPNCSAHTCTRGCYCRPSLLRHQSGQCVEAKYCVPRKCEDPNEEFACRHGCEPRCDLRTCAERPRGCTLGCHCRSGLLRDLDTGKCITPNNCTTTEKESIFKIKLLFKYLE